LQHGSILLGKGHNLLADLLNCKNEENREIIRKEIESHSISISEICGREISFEECASCIREELIIDN